MRIHCENNLQLYQVDYFHQKLHCRCSTGLRMCLRLKVLLMWGVSGRQVHGICSRRMVYIEQFEAQSSYKKSYLWWFRNPTWGDLTGSNQIEKSWVGIPLGHVWGTGGGGVVLFTVCEAPSDDWANGGSDCANGANDVFFRYGDYGFSSTGI